MGSPLPSEEYLKKIAELYIANRYNNSEVARILGKPRTTVQYWIDHLKRHGVLEEELPTNERESLQKIISDLRVENDSLKQANIEGSHPRYLVRTDAIRPRGEKIKILAIGDAHDSPHIPDKSRFEWIGKHANETKPDVILQIGDFATLDSLNTHIPNETFNGRAKKTFLDDIGSFNLALDALNSHLNHNCEKHVTLGNHERRLFAFEDNAPETMGMMQKELDTALTSHGWTYSPYGEPTFYGGVAFLHAAINRLGNTYGGKTAEMQIANDTIHDVVIGHSHIKRIHLAAKLHHRKVKVVNLGCALPDGYIEDYAQHSVTGWEYGVMELTIQHNHIQAEKWFPMSELQERYG